MANLINYDGVAGCLLEQLLKVPAPMNDCNNTLAHTGPLQCYAPLAAVSVWPWTPPGTR
jgi:hypothetical protein